MWLAALWAAVSISVFLPAAKMYFFAQLGLILALVNQWDARSMS
jgi:hypothetical protein